MDGCGMPKRTFKLLRNFSARLVVLEPRLSKCIMLLEEGLPSSTSLDVGGEALHLVEDVWIICDRRNLQSGPRHVGIAGW